MAPPQARKTTTSMRGNRRDDLSSLSTKVSRLRLQALNPPIAGNRATLLASLRRALDGRSATNAAPAGRINKRQCRGTRRQPTPVRVNVNVSSANAPPAQASRDNLAAGELEAESEDALSDAGSLTDDLFEVQNQPAARSNAFSEAQMSVLRETVQSSIQVALLQQRSHPQHFGLTSLATAGPSCRAPGVATPLGLNQPLDKNLEDCILQGEYVDFCLLLPDSIHQAQVPNIQLRVADLTPGSLGSPITMVWKRKPVIDTFHKWIDAFTIYMGVIVPVFPSRVPELTKYQQIISLAISKFKGLAWLSYDEQFCHCAAHDLTLSWDNIDLELWAVTFSGLAKPHCHHCSSPHHLQGDCPVADPCRRHSVKSYCYDFNRASGCQRQPTCPFPHICSRCFSSSHTFCTCPQCSTGGGTKNAGYSDRSKK